MQIAVGQSASSLGVPRQSSGLAVGPRNHRRTMLDNPFEGHYDQPVNPPEMGDAGPLYRLWVGALLGNRNKTTG